jgi:pilus assembly protein CpaB
MYPLEQGQPILERDLADPGTGGGLASRIPTGMRALALRSDDVVGVAGFLAPGSRVDVLVTYRAENSPEPMTATVLQDAEVLAAGQRMEPDPSGKPASATVVTLLVNPLEAERAVLASTQGTVHFVLRNGLDKDTAENLPISLSRLSSAPGTEPPAARPLVHPAANHHPLLAPPSLGVETVLGGEDPIEGKQP